MTQISGITSELLHKLRDNDRGAQKLLYDQLAPKMFALCLRYCSSYHEAEDLLQDGFIKVFHNLFQYRGEGNFEGWVRRIFVNTAIEFLRKRNQKVHPIEESGNAIESMQLNGFDKLSMEDMLTMVQQLPVGYRTVFNLYVIEGFSHKEISEMLHITEGTSKSQLARAKLQLQKYCLVAGIAV